MKIDMNKLVALVKGTKGLLTDKQAVSQVTVKGVSDYVTQVDFRVQEYLREQLHKEWPRIQFMGEEKDNSEIDFNADIWILDPVDGTTNLIHDFRNSAVSLGMCSRGEMVCGVIYQPFSDEVFTAVKGEGAFLNGEPIHVSRAETMADSLISIGTTPYEHEYANRNFEIFKKVFLDCQDIRRIGSAAIELAYVACGRLDAFFEMNLKPWDYAAGLLLIEEAGGTVTGFQGEKPVPWKKGSIVGSNGPIGQLLVDQYIN